MGAAVKKVICGIVCIAVVLLLVVFGYKGSKSKPEPHAESQPQSALAQLSTPAGSASNTTVGLMGGTLKSFDERLAISIPPGALSVDTAISVQAATDTEGIAVGPVYLLSPEGSTFALPVTLTWQLSDGDLAGRQISDVVVATRDGDGGWTRQPGASRDPASKTVRVLATHFSYWAPAWVENLPDLRLSPITADVPVTASLGLQAIVDSELASPVLPKSDGSQVPPSTVGDADADLLAPPVPPNGDEDGDLLAKPVRPACKNWRVNGALGGNSTWGTIQAGYPSAATFVAPAKAPSRNPVVVSCEAFYKRSKIIATANVTIKDKVPGWHGHFEYTYSESHSTTAKTVAGVNATTFATESRTVTGDFNVKTDYMGWGSLDGTGTGKAEVIKTDGMRNPICSTDGGGTIKGDIKIGVGGSTNAGAGTLSLSASSDNLQGETHLDSGCTKPSSHQRNEWTASFGVSCAVSGVDFVKGGTFEADVPSDNGHGKCKVTISPN